MAPNGQNAPNLTVHLKFAHAVVKTPLGWMSGRGIGFPVNHLNLNSPFDYIFKEEDLSIFEVQF